MILEQGIEKFRDTIGGVDYHTYNARLSSTKERQVLFSPVSVESGMVVIVVEYTGAHFTCRHLITAPKFSEKLVKTYFTTADILETATPLLQKVIFRDDSVTYEERFYLFDTINMVVVARIMPGRKMEWINGVRIPLGTTLQDLAYPSYYSKRIPYMRGEDKNFIVYDVLLKKIHCSDNTELLVVADFQTWIEENCFKSAGCGAFGPLFLADLYTEMKGYRNFYLPEAKIRNFIGDYLKGGITLPKVFHGKEDLENILK